MVLHASRLSVTVDFLSFSRQPYRLTLLIFVIELLVENLDYQMPNFPIGLSHAEALTAEAQLTCKFSDYFYFILKQYNDF